MDNKNDLSETSAHSILRLINFIIDTAVWLTLYLSAAFVLDEYVVRFSSYTVNYIYSISLGLVLFLAYYSLLEFYTGRTLGKWLTGTKVVDRYGGVITFSTVLIRSVTRLIPIDIFYYLFSRRGLHDRLSNTLVIKTTRNKS